MMEATAPAQERHASAKTFNKLLLTELHEQASLRVPYKALGMYSHVCYMQHKLPLDHNA